MKQHDLVAALERLIVATQAVSDEECKLGPQWLSDQSLNALDRLRQLLVDAKSDILLVGEDFSLAGELGQSWVDIESDVYDLVQQIDHQFFGAPLEPN